MKKRTKNASNTLVEYMRFVQSPNKPTDIAMFTQKGFIKSADRKETKSTKYRLWIGLEIFTVSVTSLLHGRFSIAKPTLCERSEAADD